MDYRYEAPPILRDYLIYHETIKGHSRATVDEYFLDLRNFFRFLKIERFMIIWRFFPATKPNSPAPAARNSA